MWTQKREFSLYIVIDELFALCLKFINVMHCIFISIYGYNILLILNFFFCKYPRVSVDIHEY